MEETKTTKTATKTLQYSIELPQLAKKPFYKAQPLLLYDAKTGTTRFNLTTALAVIHSLQLTMKDVHRFGEDLRRGCEDEDIAFDQVLKMVDCRGPEMRALYAKAALEFLKEYLGTFITDHHIPLAHLATALLQLHDD